jgi:radical SAM/Cys-rich protein
MALKTVLETQKSCRIPTFESRLRQENIQIKRACIECVQINVGKLCNQACIHCHVNAGPNRTEIMDLAMMKLALDFVEASGAGTVDITGGAPELNPSFRYLIAGAHSLGKHILLRTNLTVLLEPGFQDFPEYLAEKRVEVIASLPCYTEENVYRQRGAGVFRKSIEALRRLNSLGYGRDRTGLGLHLVYNPLDASLPGPQPVLEVDYKRELSERFGLEFNRLYTITNMHIGRFGKRLERSGELESYMSCLSAAFNPETLKNLMCRRLVSISWHGYLYDCDFNQMLDLKLGKERSFHLGDLPASEIIQQLQETKILTGQHCYGCTAGNGSSCQGSLIK